MTAFHRPLNDLIKIFSGKYCGKMFVLAVQGKADTTLSHNTKLPTQEYHFLIFNCRRGVLYTLTIYVVFFFKNVPQYVKLFFLNLLSDSIR